MFEAFEHSLIIVEKRRSIGIYLIKNSGKIAEFCI